MASLAENPAPSVVIFLYGEQDSFAELCFFFLLICWLVKFSHRGSFFLYLFFTQMMNQLRNDSLGVVKIFDPIFAQNE